MRRALRPARDLRIAVDRMPAPTRRAMLDALAVNPIIVGAYTDRDGGVCPMLAAHRNGGRTSFASFAEAWDRYTRAGDGPRRATDREVCALRTMLEASIATEDEREECFLADAISAHRTAQIERARREEHEAKPLNTLRDWRQAFRRLDEADEFPERPPAAGPAESAEVGYMLSAGLMNCSSGTMHAGEVRSR